MKLLDVYVALERGQVTLEQAAVALGLTEKALKIRMTKHGARLPMVLDVLDKIHDNAIDRDTAADTLGVTVRTVNKLMLNWQVSRPLADRPIRVEVTGVKWEIRKKFAIDFIGGNLSLEKASEQASVSTRQMRRWVSQLLDKHFGMPYGDLAKLPMAQLSRMAKHIREQESLEKAVMHTVDQIADGMKTAREVGTERAAAKKLARKAAREQPTT